MENDFALLDFALIGAPAPKVAQALGKVAQRSAGQEKGAPVRGLGLSRFVPRASEEVPRLFLQPRDLLGEGPLVRPTFDHPAPADLIRVSGALPGTDLTLIEYCEGDDAEAPLPRTLSAVLPNLEVFYFRLSGVRYAGGAYAFHVYQDGLTRRRAAAFLDEEGAWENRDAGIFHPLETGSLAVEGAESPVVTPAHQAHILRGLGLDPDTLFEDLGQRDYVLVLGPDPSGEPLSEAAAHGGPRLVGPATFTESRSNLRAVRTPPLPEPGAPAPKPAAPQPWEDQVMELLVDVVDQALPEPERVPWLEDLAARLGKGELCEALAEAQVLIAYSDRPMETRLRLAQRLATLFLSAMEDP